MDLRFEVALCGFLHPITGLVQNRKPFLDETPCVHPLGCDGPQVNGVAIDERSLW